MNISANLVQLIPLKSIIARAITQSCHLFLMVALKIGNKNQSRFCIDLLQKLRLAYSKCGTIQRHHLCFIIYTKAMLRSHAFSTYYWQLLISPYPHRICSKFHFTRGRFVSYRCIVKSNDEIRARCHLKEGEALLLDLFRECTMIQDQFLSWGCKSATLFQLRITHSCFCTFEVRALLTPARKRVVPDPMYR